MATTSPPNPPLWTRAVTGSRANRRSLIAPRTPASPPALTVAGHTPSQGSRPVQPLASHVPNVAPQTTTHWCAGRCRNHNHNEGGARKTHLHTRATRINIPDRTCDCPQHQLPPPLPSTLPFPAKKENRAKLERYLLERYKSSTFNTCEHQPLRVVDSGRIPGGHGTRSCSGSCWGRAPCLHRPPS